ncbi:MAG: substrate-binding domain-containing protein [Gammaproteobacteria bacterium]|nr:substrate-binding domain-containing protein [Gammaproteobacteria bacterium]
MRGGKFVAFSIISAFIAESGLAQSAGDEDLVIYAAAAVKTSLTEIAANHERMTGRDVTVVFDSAGATQRNYLADPEADLLITSPARIEQAQNAGSLPEGTTIVLGTTVAGVAVPPGSAKPDISSAENLRAALLAAERIAFSDPSRGATVGNHFMTVIEALGIEEEVLAKATLAPNGIETMRLVLEDGVDIGITQSVEILQENRDALAGPFPPEFELATSYALWHDDNIKPAARDFVAVLLEPESRAIIAEEGLAPPD